MNVRFTRRASLDLQTILSGLEDNNPQAAMRLSQQLRIIHGARRDPWEDL